MSRSKAKGTAAETAVVRFLRAVGFTQAERRTLSGVQDRGDIAGLPGVVIEVKNCARDQLPAWLAEAERERDNDHASLGVVWHKRRGTTDPGAWFVTMSGTQFVALLREQQGLPAPAADLTGAERQFLTFALDLAFDRMVSDDGFTEDDDAALAKFRAMADPAPQRGAA
ncbi:hypothetical protein [Streptomyces longispororuber]|uniref:hypothetical protein n=1 Tax=Streptomyces longispororuber TaxID=68230 RepID=UPI0036FD796D